MIDHTEALSDPTRLAAVASYDVDHPQLRECLDALAARTASTLGTPIGMISLLADTAQLIAGAAGLDGTWMGQARGVPSEWAFCSTTVVSGAPYVIPDAAADHVHHDNPLVTMDGALAYAGVPLVTSGGQVVGATCVADFGPRQFTPQDVEDLEEVSREAMELLEQYRHIPVARQSS